MLLLLIATGTVPTFVYRTPYEWLIFVFVIPVTKKSSDINTKQKD